jgi:hypothetical protein
VHGEPIPHRSRLQPSRGVAGFSSPSS